jgi:hypothetical protein
MQLKLFVLSASSVVLWIVPLAALDKTRDIHKALQGVSLTAAIACAVTAGNIARKQAEQNEIEEIKARAITADVVDEIATSAYISQQQRQQEAELILTSPGVDVEESRKVLEAIYNNDLQDYTSASEHPDYPIYLEVCKSREAGKSTTWIVENILKMGGRKFSDGKVKLQTLLNQFEEDGTSNGGRGGVRGCCSPPGRDLPARLQPGMVIPGITPKKNTTMVDYEILKKASLTIRLDFSN